MAQYKTGTVSVTNGSATVTGSGTLWSGEIAAGDLFTIVGDNAWYEVASVGSNTSITLSANYAGTTGSGKSYAISRDFTTRLALPYPQKGDIETASIIKRAFEQIDTETNIATANYSATSAPTANDDSGDGYSIGSWWVNVTSDEAYLCVDATVGAAVWTKISVDVPSEIVALLAGQSVSMNDLTLSGGTANGVLYLNGSKVATSGSALTFDGTNLGVTSGVTTLNQTVNGSAVLVTGTTGSAVNNYISLNHSPGGGAYSYTAIQIAGADIFSAGGNLSSYGGSAIVNSPGSTGGIIFRNYGTEGMRLTSTGLGIGTSSPGVKLDVSYADSAYNPGIRVTNTANTTASQAKVYAVNNAGDYISLGRNSTALGGGSSIYSTGAYPLEFFTNDTLRATLDSSGNLGIGTSSPQGKLHIKTGTNQNLIISSQGGNLSFEVANDAYSANTAVRYYASAHTWYAGGNTMTLDASGRLGIGVTNPSVGLVVAFGTDGIIGNYYSSSGANSRISFSNTSLLNNNVSIGSSSDALVMYTGGSERARIDSSGNLLVGTTTNIRTSKFVVGGTLGGGTGAEFDNDSSATWIPLAFHTASTLVGYISATTSITTYNSVSDYRLKNVIGNVTGSGARIDALEPVEYEWKENGERTRGFLAHKFQEVYPQSVTGTKDAVDADGNPVYQAMQASTSEVIADLVAEIKSLRARVAQLESN